MSMGTTPTFWVNIFMAGDHHQAKTVLQRRAKEIGLCVTVTPTTYVYTGGREEGFIVGLINYPRFPKKPLEIRQEAFKIADLLKEELGQDSYSVMDPLQTVWMSDR